MGVLTKTAIATLTHSERIKAGRRGEMPKFANNGERQRWKRYGLFQVDYERMLAQHDGACWACKELVSYELYVDHDHETNEVRGLLCARCNTIAGMLDDERLWAVWKYLFRPELLLSFMERALGTDDRICASLHLLEGTE